ncbi:MAG TPA: hypothetical protein VGJ07_01345, partial [Rugosimonospora sp.]
HPPAVPVQQSAPAAVRQALQPSSEPTAVAAGPATVEQPFVDPPTVEQRFVDPPRSQGGVSRA